MTAMTKIFGEVAGVYDEVRPGYPGEIPAAILAYHGATPAHVVELGAGTGKGTEALLALGAPLTCVEPDPRMAVVLQAKYPQARVELSTFEEWTPPPGGVPLIACAMAWHWLDEATRNQRVRDALTPGGALAVFSHKYGYADPAQSRAITAAYHLVDPGRLERTAGWFLDDITASGRFVDIETVDVRRGHEMSGEDYLRLVRTFSPFRKKSPDAQARTLAALAAALDGFGGAITLDLHTTLVLARRPR
jgi:hypothetical protein